MSEFFILAGASGDEFCRIFDEPPEVRSMIPATRGASMSDRWSEGLTCKMARQYRGLQVADVVRNALRCLMVSDALKTLLEAHVRTPVEYLRFTLLNHKGRVASDSMWLVNLLDTVPCADMAKTKGSESPFHPGEIQDLLELHILPDKVPADRNVFRVQENPSTILVRDTFRALMDKAGMRAEYRPLGQMLL